VPHPSSANTEEKHISGEKRAPPHGSFFLIEEEGQASFGGVKRRSVHHLTGGASEKGKIRTSERKKSPDS